jgi:hypothetical protein
MNPTAAALLDTLAICRQELPKDTHPIHLIRIQVIERLIKHAVEREPQLWASTLARGERVVDQVQAQRRR